MLAGRNLGRTTQSSHKGNAAISTRVEVVPCLDQSGQDRRPSEALCAVPRRQAGGRSGRIGAGVETEAPRGAQKRCNHSTPASSPGLTHRFLQRCVCALWQRVPFIRQRLPERDHLQRRKCIGLNQVSRCQQQKGQGIRDQVPAERYQSLSQICAASVSFEDLSELPAKMIVDLCNGAQEAPGIPSGKELRMVQHIAAEAAHTPDLLFTQVAAAGVGTKPALQELAEFSPRVVSEGALDAEHMDAASPSPAITLIGVEHVQCSYKVSLLPALQPSLD
mmetsp:Transcript_15165/g.26985  ORF Transcript_15165/g.26985 Transcript_15165/m.26985 type:complete len:277 (-) Transcript_15165:288-1118(-)